MLYSVPRVVMMLLLLSLGAVTAAQSLESQLSSLAGLALNATFDSLGSGPQHPARWHQRCTRENLKIRKEWSAFSRHEKVNYIDAVLCLQKKPALTPANLAKGARTRYDDFVATHINQTLEIHYTGTFLAWHRWFTWIFEQSLIDECGYEGTIPYWNWPASAGGLESYPIFDGSHTSMSGNGAKIEGEGNVVLTLGDFTPVLLPPGTGGGCVTSGPFVNYTINMGPASLPLANGSTIAVANPLDYNPRCFKRDLTTAIIQKYANYSSVVNLILQNNDIWGFEMTMQGIPGSGSIGVHGGGHYAMGGDPGRDVFVSPGDPAFWHHHGMIDRVWWIWQNLDLAQRQNAISGTGTFLNTPPSPNTTLETIINVGFVGPAPIAMRELMSTVAGPFCYIYM